MCAVPGPRVSRRELLAAGAVAGAAVGTARATTRAAGSEWTLDFAALGDGDGWPGWTCPGVGTLRRAGGLGLLEAGSDVFPCDPRPVAFAVDRRFRDGAIEATIDAGGAGTGLVLRRTGPRDYLAAIYDDEQSTLVIVRRTPEGAQELARALSGRPASGAVLAFEASGAALHARLGAVELSATDVRPRAGDPGVLATSRTLFPSAGPEVLPALGNLHLLPYGVQEGQAFFATPAGEAILSSIRERSTAAFTRIVVRTAQRARPTTPSVIAAGTGAPVAGGARIRLATDVPAKVEIEIADNPGFRRSRRLKAVATDDFDALQKRIRATGAERVHWRAHLKRRGRTATGPTRSFKANPTTLAIGSCASQFGPVFDRIAERRPDVFVWQGDLNYPDTLGPLAQTVPGYAGIWRDFLANPQLAPIFDTTAFAVQRDDHDYGVQDANSTNLVEHGLTPWTRLMERRHFYRFTAGQADVWVLDQRLNKSDPALPDGEAKTLLGAAQRAWLLRTLDSSKARYKVVCSPCTLAPIGANARDGSWAEGFEHERDLILEHADERTVFVSGDTHWTMAFDTPELLEVRPCPMGIPTPNDITLTSPNAAEDAAKEPGVAYADDNLGHVAFLDASDDLKIELVDETGATRWTKTLA
jgi:hypothetical protein